MKGTIIPFPLVRLLQEIVVYLYEMIRVGKLRMNKNQLTGIFRDFTQLNPYF
ncbi:hypothetical protein MiAbW_03548 [Microcystis aeruginosa NIES-4325]|uniref:Uncharacterized protein n=1 Tax=Microcystis aeruginosa NIES-4325 TaxID=2569534 RepID=A0A5J4FCC6_MICAE|nr:hypothetical protein MiAbW_03548 [Microcystis aeruginosa NIES-4325]